MSNQLKPFITFNLWVLLWHVVIISIAVYNLGWSVLVYILLLNVRLHLKGN
jgi:hypothetical protein